MNQQALSSVIWSVADLLRGDFKQSEYDPVILPFTVLQRLECVLEPPRPLEVIEADIKALEDDIKRMLSEVTC